MSGTSSAIARRHATAAAVSAAALGLATGVAANRAVHPHEARVFHHVNQLPSALGIPLGGVMQSGNYLATWVVAGALWREGDQRRAAATAAAGTGAWLGAKAIKASIGRGRPSAELDGRPVTIRGREQTGLGYPSGHAAVATALGVVAGPALPRSVRPLSVLVPAATIVARMYVGAHLPLDVVGGAALGILTGSLGGLVAGDRSARPRASGLVSRRDRPSRRGRPCR